MSLLQDAQRASCAGAIYIARELLDAVGGKMSLRYDLDYFPLVVLHFEAGDMDAAVDQMIEKTSGFLRQGTQFATLVYANAIVEAKQRARFARWEKQYHEQLRQSHLGIGIVLRSSLVRGALTALRWIAPAPQPELITSSSREAADFCLRILAEAGVSDLARARRYVSKLETESRLRAR